MRKTDSSYYSSLAFYFRSYISNLSNLFPFCSPWSFSSR